MQHITTLTTPVPLVGENQQIRQNRRLDERTQDLVQLARVGYSLAHTVTITGPEFITFIDTLTRNEPN